MMAVGMPLSGIILVDKGEGVTSHDVVVRARKILGMKKIGHAGTLDPFATGLLILMVGEGTKLSPCLMADEKVYRARIRLGEKTDTGDLTGEVTGRSPYGAINEEDLKAVLADFRGKIFQMPPMYSAVKKDGTPLYKLARRGIEIERDLREVFVRRIDLIDLELPFLDIEVECSKGTYLRTLAEDISEALGTCGHLRSLRRMRSGQFAVEDAISSDEIEDRESILGSVVSLRDSLPLMPEIVVKGEMAERIKNGCALRSEWVGELQKAGIKRGDRIKVTGPDGSLLSVAEAISDIGEGEEMPPGEVIGRSLRVFNGCKIDFTKGAGA